MKTNTIKTQKAKKTDTGAHALTLALKAKGFGRNYSYTDKRVGGKRYKLSLLHKIETETYKGLTYNIDFTEEEAKVIEKLVRKYMRTKLFSIVGIGSPKLTLRIYLYNKEKEKQILKRLKQKK